MKSLNEELQSAREQNEQLQTQLSSNKKTYEADLSKLKEELKETLDNYNLLLQQQKQKDQLQQHQRNSVVSINSSWRSPQPPNSGFPLNQNRHNSLTSVRADLQPFYDEPSTRRPLIATQRSISSSDMALSDSSKAGSNVASPFATRSEEVFATGGKPSNQYNRRPSVNKMQPFSTNPYLEHGLDSGVNSSASSISLSNVAPSGNFSNNGGIGMGISTSTERIPDIREYEESDVDNNHDFQLSNAPFTGISDGFRFNSTESNQGSNGANDSRYHNVILDTPTTDAFGHRFEDSSTVDGANSVNGTQAMMSVSASVNVPSGTESIGGHTSAAGTGGPGASIQLVGRMSRTIRTLESELSSVKMDLTRATTREEEATKEVLRLVKESGELEAIKESSRKMTQRIEELENREKVALEMLGEKAERVEELKADVEDMKEMYREQIESLIDQLTKANKK